MVSIDGLAILPQNGTCITLQASSSHKWWNILADKYYSCADKKEKDHTDCKWHDIPFSDDEKDKLKETHIKYTDRRTDFSLSIIIFFTTGSINIQGKHKNLETWITEHYPALKKLYDDAPSDEKQGGLNLQ